LKEQRSLQLAGIVALVGLGWLSRDAVWAWRHAPYDWGAGWVALIWVGWLVWQGSRSGAEPKAALLGAGIGLGLLSWIGDLNAAAHAGLVLAAASWLPSTKRQIGGAIMGMAWLPAFGWVASSMASPLVVFGLRLAWVSGVALALRKKTPSPETA